MKTNCFLLAAIFGFALTLTLSCSSSDDSSSKPKKPVKREKVTGISQKGPFVRGSKVTIYELDSTFEKTKNSFEGKTDGKGYFDIEINGGKLASPYVILEVSGRYLNEVSGEQTADPIKLNAIADVSVESSANINALTHLEFERVLKLVKEGEDFDDAKKQAQTEVLEALGISEKGMINSENADIFGSSVSDSVLMVVSILMQGNRSVEKASELLDRFGGEIRDKGVSKSILEEVKEGFDGVDMGKVREHIRNLYPEVKEPDISVFLPPEVPSSSSFFVQSSSSYFEPGFSSSSSSSFFVVPVSSSSPAFSSSSYFVSSSSTGTTYSPPYVPPSNSTPSQPYVPPVTSSSSSSLALPSSSSEHSSSSEEHSSSSLALPSSSSEPSSSSAEPSSSSGPCDDFVPDGKQFCDERDGKRYNYVTINAKIWMAENLNYNASGSLCYNNTESNCNTYGRHYNWSMAMAGSASSTENPSGVQGVCPPGGWHLPSTAEWQALVTFAGSSAAQKLRSTSGWEDLNGLNTYGFSALPGGYVWPGSDECDGGPYCGLGSTGIWWSSSEKSEPPGVAIAWGTDALDYDFYSTPMYKEPAFLSVRCVKN